MIIIFRLWVVIVQAAILFFFINIINILVLFACILKVFITHIHTHIAEIEFKKRKKKQTKNKLENTF